MANQKKHFLTLLLATALAFPAAAQQHTRIPLENPEYLDKLFIECAETSFQNQCVETLHKKHSLALTSTLEEISRNIQALAVSSISGFPVNKVYLLKGGKSAIDIYAGRAYLIQTKEGYIAIHTYLLQKVPGEGWYIENVNIFNSPEQIAQFLGIFLPSQLN